MHHVYVYLIDDATCPLELTKGQKQGFQQTVTNATCAVREKVQITQHKIFKSGNWRVNSNLCDAFKKDDNTENVELKNTIACWVKFQMKYCQSVQPALNYFFNHLEAA